MTHFEIYRSGLYWYWRLRAGNGQIIAQGEGYVREDDCRNAIGLVQGTTYLTPVQAVAA